MGNRIDDGHPTTIEFTAAESYSIGERTMWEKELTPPSIEGGGANDTTTMRNSTWRTKSPKSLLSLGDASITIAYQVDIYTEMVALVNVNQSITITFPDGSQLTFWGWIDDFSPNACVEGEQPTADLTIICSNQDDSGVETAPTVS